MSLIPHPISALVTSIVFSRVKGLFLGLSLLFVGLVWSVSWFYFNTGNTCATQKMVLTTLEGDLPAYDSGSPVILP